MDSENQTAIEQIDRVNIPSNFKVMAGCDFTSPVRKTGNWYHAVPPLVQERAGLGLIDYFGRVMAQNLPDKTIGVVPVATFHNTIQELSKYADPAKMGDQYNKYGKHAYSRLITLAKRAQQQGVIKGILLQDERNISYVNDPQWEKVVKILYDDILADLNLDANNVPLFIGELPYGQYQGSNERVKGITSTIPTAKVISAKDCGVNTSNAELFTADGVRLMGGRYAQAALKVLNPESNINDDAVKSIVVNNILACGKNYPDIAKYADLLNSNISTESKYYHNLYVDIVKGTTDNAAQYFGKLTSDGQMLNEVRAAVESFLAMDGYATHTDVTAKIQNADGTALDGWTNDYKVDEDKGVAKNIVIATHPGDCPTFSTGFQGRFLQASWSNDHHYYWNCSQDVSLEPGKYRLSAFVRTNQEYANGSADYTAYLYAGTDKDNATKGALNHRGDDSNLFNVAGWMPIYVDFEVPATEGAAEKATKIGFYINASGGYASLARFRLVKYDGENRIVPTKIEAKTEVDEAKEALGNADYANVTGTERTALQAAIDDPNHAGIAKALSAFRNAKTAYDNFANACGNEFLAKFRSMLLGPGAAETAELAQKFIDMINGKATDAVDAQSKADAGELLRQALESNNTLGAYTDAVDCTNKITNPEGNTFDGWQHIYTGGPTVVADMTDHIINEAPLALANGQSQTNYFEALYNTKNTWTWDVAQEIVSLEPGKYRLSAFVRYNENVVKENTYMYAGDTKGDFEFKYRDKGPFNAGWQPIFVDFEVAAADTPVKIGFHIESAPYSYAGVCNFRLVKFGTTNNLEQVLNAYIDQEKEALLSDELYAVVTGDERTALGTANFDNLDDAAAAFKNARTNYALYANAMSLVENYKDLLNADNAYVKSSTLNEYNDLFNATAPTNAAAALTATENVKKVTRAAIESATKLEGFSGNTNATEEITNPNGDNTNGWETVFTNGDATSDYKMESYNEIPFSLTDGTTYSNSFLSKWNTNEWAIDFSQQLTNLPVGFYRLSAFVRTNAKNKYTKLYAGENTKDAVWYDIHWDSDADNPNCGLYTKGIENVFIDFDVVKSSANIAARRAASTTPVFTQGTPVKIGVKAASHAGGSYFNITGFRLYKSPTPSGIENVSLDAELEPAEKVYYDLMGRRVSNPTPGLYICNGKKVYVK